MYQDAGGKHGSQWRIVARQHGTGELLLRDWMGGRVGYGVMLFTWGDLVEEHGPITFSHYLKDEAP